MDIINNEKKYPQLVEVVNKVELQPTEENPIPISFPSSFVDQTSLKTFVGNTATWVFSKPASNKFNVHVEALYIVEPNSGLTQIVPLGSSYYNLSNAQITSMETGFHNFNLLYPASSRAYVIYSKIGNNLVAEQVVYSLQ